MSDKITIRELETMSDINKTVELQKAVWRMSDVEASSPHTLRAIVHAGGAVIAAEAAGRLVGFCFGMAAWRAGELWLWSHMAGVRPEYQGRGIGLKLKLAQRKWALSKGFRRMAWTFDPMQSGNANFNFNRLGATARAYSVNHYGDMQDDINAGMASDRLEAQWQLDSPRVIALAEGGGQCPPPPSPVPPSVPPLIGGQDSHNEGRGANDFPETTNLVYVDSANQLRHQQPDNFSDARYGIEIPFDIAGLKAANLERAMTWQMSVRRAMTSLLDAGYIVSGFVRDQDSARYILSREP